MMHLVKAVLMGVAFFLSACATVSGSGPDIHLVRHAEKVDSSSDAALSEAGHARAAALADRLADAGIVRIYSTDYQRTRDTAAPLAEQLGLEIELYDPSDLRAFASELQRGEGHALIVGHSNTTPQLVTALGGAPGPDFVEATDYSRLYIVTRKPGGTHTELQRYGPPDPEAP